MLFFVVFSDTIFPIGVSLFVMVIGAMMIYGAFTHRSGWLVPFLCYQMFDFAIHCLMMLGFLKTLPTLKAQAHLYKNELWDLNTNWLIAFLLLICGLFLVLKAYFLCCVWNCYKYIVNRYAVNAQVFSDRNVEQFLPPSYDTAIAIPNKVAPPPYSA
uniref:lysosomal-associated transmembrane protein 4A-like n=1 Tax=Myxine glutinosa TaxID=7769 RepID=UPI00358EC889